DRASASLTSSVSSPGTPKTYRTPSRSRQRTRSSAPVVMTGLRDPDRLDVDELADAVLRELAAVPRALDPAERQARIRLHDAVHEHRAGFDRRRETVRAPAIPRPQRR